MPSFDLQVSSLHLLHDVVAYPTSCSHFSAFAESVQCMWTGAYCLHSTTVKSFYFAEHGTALLASNRVSSLASFDRSFLLNFSMLYA
uniref:Uncharacterized protein n=1 Tax=Arundo donax TaxID=35708 RepID=A0A0A9BUS5_ARUDO